MQVVDMKTGEVKETRPANWRILPRKDMPKPMIDQKLKDARASFQEVANHCRTYQLDKAYAELDKLEGLVGDLKTEINSVGHSLSKHGNHPPLKKQDA